MYIHAICAFLYAYKSISIQMSHLLIHAHSLNTYINMVHSFLTNTKELIVMYKHSAAKPPKRQKQNAQWSEVLLLPASNYICIRATPATIIYHFWGQKSMAVCYIFYPIKNPTAALEIFVWHIQNPWKVLKKYRKHTAIFLAVLHNLPGTVNLKGNNNATGCQPNLPNDLHFTVVNTVIRATGSPEFSWNEVGTTAKCFSILILMWFFSNGLFYFY